MKSDQSIIVIDDDEGARRGLEALLSEHDYSVKSYESAHAFLSNLKDKPPGCVILDIMMPEMTGLELQEELLNRKLFTPIIFVTGHGKITWSVQAMKRGAVNFLEKPYEESELIDSIEEALQQDQLNRRIGLNCPEIIKRFDTLTNREKEVVEYLVYGEDESTNKAIAKKLDISYRTVEEYRSQAMKKLQANNLKELITMVIVCKLAMK